MTTITNSESLDVLDFPVQAQDLYRDGYVKLEGFKTIVRTDTGKALGIMRKNYQLVTHRQALTPIVEKLTGEGWNVNKVGVEMSGSRAFVELLNKNELKPVKVGDLVGKRVTLLNSYDGTTSIRAEIGTFRLVCLNGMVRPSGDGMTQSLKHTSAVFEKLENMGVVFEEAFQRMFLFYTSLVDKAVPKDIAEKIIEVVAGKRKSDLIKNLWVAGRGNDGRETAWNLYNAITEYLTHNFKGSYETRTAKGRLAIDRLLELK